MARRERHKAGWIVKYLIKLIYLFKSSKFGRLDWVSALLEGGLCAVD